jgi:hypothetical protein
MVVLPAYFWRRLLLLMLLQILLMLLKEEGERETIVSDINAER